MQRSSNADAPPVPPKRPFTTTRARALITSCALLACIACAVAGSSATAASSNVVVSMEVPSATTLVTSACAPGLPGITDFGVVQPGTTAMTGTDCSVTFGSSNDSASLRLAQSDGIGTAMAQATGEWTRNTGSSSRMISIDSIPGTMLALRSNGQVYRSLDAGASWAPPFSAGTSVYADIAVATSTTAWVSTNGPQVRRSTNINGGSPSFADTTASPGMLQTRAITAPSATTAWVVGSGGEIASTTNGGSSWTPHASPTTSMLTGVHQLDLDSLLAWGVGGVVVATSNGTTWRDLGFPGPSVNDAWMITDDIVVVVTDSRVYRTTNATNVTPTWSQIDPLAPFDLEVVHFVDAVNGFALGVSGVMFTTDDAGATWQEDDVDSTFSIADVTSPAAGTLVGVGAGNSIQRSIDAGASWNQALGGFQASWDAVAAATDGRAWRVGSNGRIERSSDAGVSWTPQGSSTTEDLLGVAAFDSERVIAVGREGEIVTTSDGGATWSVRTGATSSHLYHVDTTSDGVAWAVGQDGTVLRSNDHGLTWSVQQSMPGTLLTTISAVSPTHAVAFGPGGTAVRTSDGQTWSPSALPTGSTDVFASAARTGSTTIGYVASGRYVQSTDAGATWSILSPPSNLYVEDIAWAGDDEIWATGQGVRYHSIDGGATWSYVASSGHWATSLATADPSRLIEVGDGNLSSTTGSTNPVADYANGASDWYDDGVEAFGACLRATDATPTWSPNATCDMSADGAHWRGISTGTGPGSEVARAASIAGMRTASFRFGLRVDPAQPPGTLSAGLTFVLLAPAI